MRHRRLRLHRAPGQGKIFKLNSLSLKYFIVPLNIFWCFKYFSAGHSGEAHHASAPDRVLQQDRAGQLAGGYREVARGAEEELAHQDEDRGEDRGDGDAARQGRGHAPAEGEAEARGRGQERGAAQQVELSQNFREVLLVW